MITIPGWSKVQLFSVDAASYKMPKDWAFLEVYTMIPRKHLLYEKIDVGPDSTAFEASIEMVCSIISGEITLASDTLDATDVTADTSEITYTQSLPYVFTFQIKSGDYKLRCQLIDRKAGYGDVSEDDLTIPNYPDSGLAMSDIELAIRIDRESEQSEKSGSKFYKNGYMVYPNPQNIYGESLPRLSYYAELYNLNFQQAMHGNYSVNVEVLDSDQKPFRTYEAKVRPIAGSSIVETGGFSVATYESGSYYLKLTVVDSTTGEDASRFKKFFVWHPGELAQKSSRGEIGATRIMIPTNYAMMDESQVDEAIESITYLLSPQEKKQLDKLNLDGKRTFLDKFWSSRDPDPSTAENERRTEHYRRVEQANQMFGYLNIDGWKTDRGRVWVLYGRPDTEDSHPMEIDARAYKIWYYDNLEGGVEFVFVDQAGFGNYELVHSTKKGEIYNSNWYDTEVMGYRVREGGRSFQPSGNETRYWQE